MISGISSILELAPFKFASEGFTGLIGYNFPTGPAPGVALHRGGEGGVHKNWNVP